METTIQVRVRPNAKRDEVLGYREGILQLAVAAVPREGQANEALLSFLAKSLGVKRDNLSIRAGTRRRVKLVRMTGIDRAEVEKKIKTLIAEASTDKG